MIREPGYSSKVTLLVLAGFLVFPGCVEDTNTDGSDLAELHETSVDVSKSNIINVGGELFSIPSPIETAILLKESGATFDNSFLNDPESVNSYTSKVKKALNLGVYGADLGYLAIYDNTTDALKYLKVVQTLLDDLGVSGAFDQAILKRFGSNLGNQDSMLVLVGDAFKAGDAYLKKNERNDVASLILAGGWIEALHFATQVAKADDEEVLKRIGEQKSSLNHLIKLLMQNYSSDEQPQLIQSLKDLHTSFETIEYTYEFVPPEVDVDKRRTKINSKTTVGITDEHLKEITVKIQGIRTQIIQ